MFIAIATTPHMLDVIKVNDHGVKGQFIETNKCPGALQHVTYNKFVVIYL